MLHASPAGTFFDRRSSGEVSSAGMLQGNTGKIPEIFYSVSTLYPLCPPKPSSTSEATAKEVVKVEHPAPLNIDKNYDYSLISNTSDDNTI